jgi:hypothetical protein
VRAHIARSVAHTSLSGFRILKSAEVDIPADGVDTASTMRGALTKNGVLNAAADELLRAYRR